MSHTPTPRKESARLIRVTHERSYLAEWVPVDFARTLERENADLLEALEDIARGHDEHESYSGSRCAEIARAAIAKTKGKS